MRVLTLATLTLLFAGTSPPRAFASQPGNVQLCNHFPVPVRFAVAWKAHGIAYSKGWYTVASSRCTRVTIAATTIFWRGETNDYVEPDGRTVSTSWSDRAHPFCTSKNGFYFSKADGPCGKFKIAGYNTSFRRTDGSPIYETVTINHDGSSSHSIGAGHFQEFESS